MGVHHLRCSECGHTVMEVGTLGDDVGDCPKCGSPKWGVHGGMSRRHTGTYHKPIQMQSIAPATDEEIADFRRRNPDVTLTPDGIPLAHSLEEKKRILRTEGYEDRNGYG